MPSAAMEMKPLYEVLKLFLVDMAPLGFAKIDSINTWLTCEKHCWKAVGSNNIYRKAAEPDAFRIYIHMKGITADSAKSKKFVLHYKIEGLC